MPAAPDVSFEVAWGRARAPALKGGRGVSGGAARPALPARPGGV